MCGLSSIYIFPFCGYITRFFDTPVSLKSGLKSTFYDTLDNIIYRVYTKGTIKVENLLRKHQLLVRLGH